MAGKKVKYRSKPKKIDTVKLKPSDIICPICRTVLIEPVSLPCDHVFCKFCFDNTMENANLVCPLCRIRVGSWYRKAKKGGHLIDVLLWEAIKIQYPNEVENKYKGIDNVIEQDKPTIIVSNPGEIRKEYEIEKQKQEEELRKIHDAEEKASDALIKQLKQEEEYRSQLEQEKIRLDEEFARKISNELMPSTSKLTKDLVKKRLGPLDKFLQNKNSKVFKLPQNNDEVLDDTKPINTSHNICKIVTPNNISTKPYTCQVLYIDNNSSSKVSYLEGTGTIGSKIKKKNQNNELNERKNMCQSECGSNGSRENSDVIDQECKFYFKPIDLYKKYHIQGHLPLKIPCRKNLSETSQILPPSGVTVNLLSGSQTSAFVKIVTVQEENKGCDINTNLSRKRKYNQLIDCPSSNDNFYGFKKADINKSLMSCDNLVAVLLKLDNNVFRRKFNEITEYKKKITQEYGCHDIHQPIVFKINPNKIEEPVENNTYKLGESEADMSPILNKNSHKKAVVTSLTNIENNNKKQNNLFRSSDHKILIYSDTQNNDEDTSALCNLPTFTVKNFYSSSCKNITTSKIPNKHTKISQNQMANSPINVHSEINIRINKVHDVKGIKSSPKRIKLNTTGNIKSIQYEKINNLDQKKIQEESDFELAKKLQAEFDLIHIPSRTRRGTTRQITLDEMLLA